MAARMDSACKFICAAGDWRITNLQLQKLLYISQMAHLGMHGSRLFDAAFEAWDYGPVAPLVYRKVRQFGSAAIRDVFFEALPFNQGSPKLEILSDVCRDLISARSSHLVEITHWGNGAWAKWYEPGVRGIKIPDTDIAAEFKARVEAGHIHPDQPSLGGA